MPIFRKIPVLIKAEQYNGPESIYCDEKHDCGIDGVTWEFRGGQDGLLWPTIKTLEGNMLVSPGDWVITGVKGEKYPCKDSIFTLTYEFVG